MRKNITKKMLNVEICGGIKECTLTPKGFFFFNEQSCKNGERRREEDSHKITNVIF